MNEAKERVARGAAWLDKAAPGWELRIDLGELEMSSCTHCIVGQVFGNFEEVEFEDLSAEELGFEFHFIWTAESMKREFTVDYEDLAKEWTRVIKDRLDHGVVV